MRHVQAEPFLLHENEETVQIAQRQTSMGFMLAILATAGLWAWRYAALHRIDLMAILVILGLYAAGRAFAYFLCRLEPAWKWIAVSAGVLVLVASALIAMLP